MKHPIRRRLHAQEQLELHVDRIAEDNLEPALRFIAAFEASLELLSEMPEAGPRFESGDPRLARLRKWVIPRYPRYVIFYLFERGAIHLIDVVDARSDYEVQDEP